MSQSRSNGFTRIAPQAWSSTTGQAGFRKTLTLKATEFIRRFLLQVLPAGFVRISHYGFLANRVCREKLALCRELLGVGVAPEPIAARPVSEPKGTVEGEPAAHACPVCGEGRMVIIETLRATPVERRGRSRPGPTAERAGFDTS